MGPEIKEQAPHPAPNLLQFLSQVGPSHQRNNLGECFFLTNARALDFYHFAFLSHSTHDASAEAACPRGA